MNDRELVERYESLAPGDAEWARRATAPYADMSPEERLRALAVLNSWVDSILAGRSPERQDGELPFWMYWKDPGLGRPR